jgi:hypothetical protein
MGLGPFFAKRDGPKTPPVPEHPMNGASSMGSGRRRHSLSQGSISDPIAKEADMKKFFALAGVAAALVVAVPMAAQADSYRHVERDGPRGGHYERDVYHGHSYHQQRRDFDHWRPGLERARYHGFGRPVFYDHYYRVHARDYRGRLVLLTVNAYTGAIISVGF